MLRRMRKNKAFSTIEYAVLLGIISAAIITMYPYMRRAVNARVKNMQLELDEWRR